MQHSDDALDRSAAEQLAEHDEGGGVVYYWHLGDLGDLADLGDLGDLADLAG